MKTDTVDALAAAERASTPALITPQIYRLLRGLLALAGTTASSVTPTTELRRSH